jgi:lactoylglutathione lyase
MIIDQITMYVNDFEGMRNFYRNYLNARCEEMDYDKKTGLTSCYVVFEPGAKLRLMSKPDKVFDMHKQVRIGLAHIVLKLNTRDEVDKIAKKVKKARYEILTGPKEIEENKYVCRFKDPEWNEIEIYAE